MRLHSKKIVLCAIMASCGIIFSYIEFLFPIPIGIPGVKLGLSNIVSLIILYWLGLPEALIVSSVRVCVSGLLFGNLFSVLYSMGGAFLALLMMYLLKKISFISIVGVSIGGGIAHNIGQIIIACLIVNNINTFLYLPVLIISGTVCGLLVGLVSSCIVKRINIDYFER